MESVEKQIHAAREKLLDLTMRNRLLNYRPTKARTIGVVDEIPREIYDLLVLQEKPLVFLPSEVEEENHFSDSDAEQTGFPEDQALTAEEVSELWQTPPPESEVAARHTDKYLQTALDSATLQKRLFFIDKQSRAFLEEQGYTVVFLALGYLKWTEASDADQIREAPLILVPVELYRAGVRSTFRLRWTGEDIVENISLTMKLKEQGINLPHLEPPEEKSDLDAFFAQVEGSIRSMKKWGVLPQVSLDFFSFAKFVMYRDLDPKSWPEGQAPHLHPLIESLLSPKESENQSSGFQEDEIDEKLNARDLYQVMDADPSQMAVIEDAKAGLNLAAEGPPGTGKSQTIANIISELLVAGKSVLFVSEKMAALDVVKSRLDSTGLGQSCLELHSRKSKKKEVLQELEKTIQADAPPPVQSMQEFKRLERLKTELNSYASALKEPFGKIGFSPYSLICRILAGRRHFQQAKKNAPRIRFQETKKCDLERWSQAISSLGNLSEIYPMVNPVASHPWRGTNPGAVLPDDEREMAEFLEGLKEATQNLQKCSDNLFQVAATSVAQTPAALAITVEGAKLMARSAPVAVAVLNNSAWESTGLEADRIISTLRDFHARLTEVENSHVATVLDQPLAEIIEEFEAHFDKLFRFINRRFFRLRKRIRSFYTTEYPKATQNLLTDLRKLRDCQVAREAVRSTSDSASKLFGRHWKGESTNPEGIEALKKWILSFQDLRRRGVLTPDASQAVADGVSSEKIEAALSAYIDAGRRFATARRKLSEKVNIDYEVVFGKAENQVSFAEFLNLLDVWSGKVSDLQIWGQFVLRTAECSETVAKPLVDLIEADTLAPEDFQTSFEMNHAESLLGEAYRERPSLACFIGDIHESKIEDFVELDSEIIRLNRLRTARELFNKRPRIGGGASAASEAGILLGEFAKKRRHKPIRTLLSDAGTLIQKIKPCFMMSPLSIAQFFKAGAIQFDVVIFDEASQVRPEDALGALLRGRQVVVMGDTRQLPPTSFFDHMVDSGAAEESELSTSVEDVESLLHLSKRAFPTKLLRWHYRSKHESLIAVSNQEFYDNRLLIYPSALRPNESLGLHFVHVPESIYDRGRSGVNRIEARTVAKAAIDHYRTHPTRSLGIGTFNVRQQQAVLEEIELQLRDHPEMEEFLSSDRSEHFFVKNLETIQGDERDVILLSIGFGFDAHRRLSRNFGPLNQEGGERRLNVLISRAREKCVVFSNFQGQDLPIESTSPFGLRALKVFLEYAQNGALRTFAPFLSDSDSPFEDEVYDFLRDHGYDVQKQIGCAGFRVDLSIIDERARGRYLLGIECDGAKYHSSPVARDRDRLRQQILEKLGWRIHRVWSTEWYRNADDTKKKLLKSIEDTKALPAGGLVIKERGYEAKDSPVSTPKEENPSVRTHEESMSEVLDPVLIYQACERLTIRIGGDLHEHVLGELAEAVRDVVKIEGPVHCEEVTRRIRTLWGLRRTGDRIRGRMEDAIDLATKEGTVRRRGDFLWPIGDREIVVRFRREDPTPKIELICDEEIGEAVKQVLREQFSTEKNDLIIQTSRRLGFQRTNETTTERISSIVARLCTKRELVESASGKIDLAER